MTVCFGNGRYWRDGRFYLAEDEIARMLGITVQQLNRDYRMGLIAEHLMVRAGRDPSECETVPTMFGRQA